MSQRAKNRSFGEPSSSAPAAGERLGIAGSGTIACGLAACAALRGLEVLVWARSEASADRARAQLDETHGGRDGTAAEAGATRVTSDLSDLAAATLVVEAVVEEETPKQAVLRSLHEQLGPGSLIATTTSSLSVSELAERSGRPEQFFGLHVFNPVQRMPLVELCFPPAADRDTRRRAAALCEALGKTAVEVPDESGFVVNRLLFPYLFDAVRMLERTGLDPERVDACMKLGASHPMGPLELLDLVGLDVAEAIGEALFADTGDAAHRPPGRLKRLVGEGRLGRKAGAGFYSY